MGARETLLPSMARVLSCWRAASSQAAAGVYRRLGCKLRLQRMLSAHALGPSVTLSPHRCVSAPPRPAPAQFLCVAAGCLPLVSHYYSGSAAAKRGILLTAAFGLLLILLRPPLPIRVSCMRVGVGRKSVGGW